MKRNIIRIDEDKCTGCGDCITDCPEGALKIINGKARLVKESLCDGMGMCIGQCPTGALTIEQRDADAFDEEEAQKNMKQVQKPHTAEEILLNMIKANQAQPASHGHHHGGGCPSSMMQHWNRKPTEEEVLKNIIQEKTRQVQSTAPAPSASALRQWPVQLHLLNPHAPYFQNADLVVVADCVPFSYANFHERFLKNKILIIFCPKLDDSNDLYTEKLTEIIASNDIRSVTTVHMQVPCCTGTMAFVERAIQNSGKRLVLKDYVISIQGEIV